MLNLHDLPVDMITQVMRRLPLQDRAALTLAHVGHPAQLSALRDGFADCWSKEDYFLAARPAHLRVRGCADIIRKLLQDHGGPRPDDLAD